MPHALELLLDADLEHRVRQAWDLLVAAGVPSQALHPHPTNRPHVTLAVTDDLDDAVRTALAAELARVTSEQAGAVVAALGALPAATGTADAARSYDVLARTTTTLHAGPEATEPLTGRGAQ